MTILLEGWDNGRNSSVDVTSWTPTGATRSFTENQEHDCLNTKFKMPAVKGEGMRGLQVFISDIRACAFFICFSKSSATEICL